VWQASYVRVVAVAIGGVLENLAVAKGMMMLMKVLTVCSLLLALRAILSVCIAMDSRLQELRVKAKILWQFFSVKTFIGFQVTMRVVVIGLVQFKWIFTETADPVETANQFMAWVSLLALCVFQPVVLYHYLPKSPTFTNVVPASDPAPHDHDVAMRMVLLIYHAVCKFACR